MNNDDYTSQMTNALRCPIDWAVAICRDDPSLKSNPPYYGDFSLLCVIWSWEFASVAIHRQEISYFPDICLYGQIMEDIEGDEDDRHALINALARREIAIQKYKDLIGWLADLRFLQPSEHKKHYKVGVKNIDDAIAASKGSPSIFSYNLSEAKLRGLFWDWFLEYFEDLSNPYLDPTECEDPYIRLQYDALRDLLMKQQTRIAVNASFDIGASDGVATAYLCIDIQRANATAHAYPVSEAEAGRIMKGGQLLRIPL